MNKVQKMRHLFLHEQRPQQHLLMEESVVMLIMDLALILLSSET